MPSDPRTRGALDALKPALEPYRSAVASAVDEVGALLARQRTPIEQRAELLGHELGAFAAGRLDAEVFATVFAAAPPPEPEALARLERAHHALRHVAGRGETLFTVAVTPGRELADYAAHALAEIGRAFGAARAFELARQGRPTEGALEGYIGGFAFRGWNRAERQIAPPLVVELDGGDAQAGGLAEFLDGRQKIVLVIRGESPPAPLVRLITPGTLVVQCTAPEELAELAAHDGPAIAALVPAGAARFVHRPGAADVAQRLEIAFLPDAEPCAAIGRYSAFQQAEELAQLRELQERGARSEERGGRSEEPGERREASEAPAADPAERLAAWLLSQAAPPSGA